MVCPKVYTDPSIRKSGNLSKGALSTGECFYPLGPLEVDQPVSESTTINSLGAASPTVEEGSLYAGQGFLHADLNISDLIGQKCHLVEVERQNCSRLVVWGHRS